ncbi:2-dehydropantoate 2-reductase [Malassezia caprae]|uniref:2-dehydropantoate 2-reductase n=1 Tax=Malassezia caprae TaxID=1381934 RepID=A0AAF0E5L0_9BASI|nr:2-dehydropantoate 2-reductase [Malassezia caprae]
MPPDSTQPRAEVLLLGLGGVGVLYAYLLQKGGAHVTCVCRSNYDVVREHGIDIHSDKYGVHRGWRPDRVVRSPDELAPCLPDVHPNHEVVRPCLERNRALQPAHLPTLVFIQNGIDIEESSHEHLVLGETPLARGILSGLTWVAVTMSPDGHSIEHSHMEALRTGTYPSPVDGAVPAGLADANAAFIELATRGGSQAAVSDDITPDRWSKLLWNASWGAASLLARRPVLELLQAEALDTSLGVVRGFLLELLDVARASGLHDDRFPASHIDNVLHATLACSPAQPCVLQRPKTILKAPTYASFRPDFKPSILIDMERARPMEIEPLFVNVVRRARRAGVETPRLDLVLATLRPSQLAFIRQQRKQDEAAHIHSSDECYIGAQDALVGEVPVLSS